MKKAIITGASGFIGKALCKRLLNDGYYVYAVVRNKEKMKDIVENNNLKIIVLDLKNYIDLLIKVAEERYPIIVELKKNTPTGHARVTSGKMIDQINKYRCAVKQSSTEYENINDTDIKVYFIISEDSGVNNVNTINFSDSDMKMFKAIIKS